MPVSSAICENLITANMADEIHVYFRKHHKLLNTCDALNRAPATTSFAVDYPLGTPKLSMETVDLQLYQISMAVVDLQLYELHKAQNNIGWNNFFVDM